ncbi:hypothetical protein AB0H12_44580 [Actinosynnema sp. NPDC023794]
MIPMLARAGVRFLQVARGGQEVGEGYDVLADSFAPTRLIRRGAWHLGRELEQALTVPQVASGRRECSYRAKGEVLDAAIADELAAGRIAAGYRHAIGFSADEPERVERDSSYTTNAREPLYPLVEWNWDRDRCDLYLHELFSDDDDPDFWWPRSCCQFCCYQSSTNGRVALALRWRSEPQAAVTSLRLESRAMALHPGQKLFGSYSAAQFVRDYGLTDIVEHAAAGDRDGEQCWTVVEVRRVYRPASVRDPVTGKSLRGRDGRTVKDPTTKGRAWRSIRPHTVTGTRAEAVEALQQLAREYDTTVWTRSGGAPRLEIRVLPKKVREWPVTTHEFAVVPGLVAAKQRRGFDKEYDDARRREARRGGENLLPLAM